MLKLKGKKVRGLIGATGLSVRAWAAEHGFAQPTLSSWLNGTRNIKKSKLVKLAEALHVADLSEISFVELDQDISESETDHNQLAKLELAINKNTETLETLIGLIKQHFSEKSNKEGASK